MKAAQFDNFVAALMEPVTEAELLDIGLGRDLRAARRGAWLKAKAATDFWQAALQSVRAADRYQKHFGTPPIQFPDNADYPDDWALVAEVRKAQAQQILTPAPMVADLEWKRRTLDLPNLPVPREELQAAIDADAAFFAAHPVRRPDNARVDAIDMPDIGAGAFPIAVGDFEAGYRIVDRFDLSILVNPFLRATDGITRFHATRRVGGGVIRPAAIRKLKVAAS